MVGWRWQCEGNLFVSIDFDAPFGNDCASLLDEQCSEHHRYGPSNDNYKAPDVMACCGEYLPESKDTYLDFCSFDVIQQTCSSMAKRLEKLVLDGSFAPYGGQGEELQQWVAANYATCFEQLYQNDSDPSPGAIVSYWAIPNSSKWSALDNFVISLDTGTDTSGVFQPVDPEDWIPCHGTTDNNDEVFEGGPAPSDGMVAGVDLANTATASLTGPALFGGAIVASPTFGASCAAKGCSQAEIFIGRTSASLEDVAFFSDGFSVSNGSGTVMLVDDARVTLYDSAAMSPAYDATGLQSDTPTAPKYSHPVFSPKTAWTVLAGVTLLTACEPQPPVEPDFEWSGRWIDIVGLDTQPDQTCAGTFQYLDDFAGSMAGEFGVTNHVGRYRWYSPERFELEDPCSAPFAGCTGSNGIFARIMPSEHEVVHLVSQQVVECPSVITEGLAEYYGTTSETPSSWDLTPVIETSSESKIESGQYPLAGAFVAYLVETHGLDGVLSFCAAAGVYPSPEEFAVAAEAAFGVAFEQILAELEQTSCSYAAYRSKVHECGGPPDLVLGTEAVELTLDIDCESTSTVGPRAGKVWADSLLRVLESGIYLAEVESSDPNSEGTQLSITKCAGCSDSSNPHNFMVNDGSSADPILLDAGDYIVRGLVPVGGSEVLTLRLSP